MSEFTALNGYEPKSIDSDFEKIKASGLECNVNWCRLETYSGEKAELQGKTFFRYEVEILGGTQDYLGRKFWKGFMLEDEKQIKKLADQLFTLGMKFKTTEELQSICEQLVDKLVLVNAWVWKRDNGDESQMHLIKGWANGISDVSSSVDQPKF